MSHVERIEDVVRLPSRPRNLHKGGAGRVLVAAGSLAYPGAAALAARGAGRGGAGLVTAACPAGARTLIAAQLVCEMTTSVSDDGLGGFGAAAGEELLELAGARDTVALGPGVARSQGTMECVRSVARLCPRPLVLDADGLYAFAGRARDLASAAGPRVLTPHPGEASRLLGAIVEPHAAQREAAALALAAQTGAVVVLKGAETVVTDGSRLHVNTTGNPGMATGGTGDVLAGLLAALLATPLDAFDAAVVAVHVHGRAGDLAAAALGERGMIATDLLDHLPRALAEQEM